MNVLVRVKRILAHLKNFKLTCEGEHLHYHSSVCVGDGETLLGVYENVSGSITHALAVSDQSLYTEQNGSWTAINFAQIEAIRPPDKDSVSQKEIGILVQHDGGKKLLIPVWGGDVSGKFRDVYEFTRFLMRTSNDAKTKTSVI